MAKGKDGSECFTRTNKSGGKYVTCKGAQKGGPKSANKKVSLAQQERSKAAAAKRKAKAKPKAKVPAIKVVKGTKKSIDLKPTEKAKPVGMIRGPTLPQRTSTTGGTGVVAKTKAPKAKAVSNFKMSASERRDLIFRWELWWRKNGAQGLRDYMKMPTRVANNAFTSKEDIENKGTRERIFQKLQKLIGDGNTSDGTTWKTITTKEIKSL